jgi:hypothetical protein
MAGRQAGVTTPSDHRTHQPLDIAALAAGDLEGDARVDAQRLVDSCTECRALHHDLLAIAHAARSEPLPVPVRPRDFTLTASDAARLRNPWRRALGWLAGPGGAVTRPLATGIATLGVVAVVLSSTTLPFIGVASGPAAELGAQDAVQASAAAQEQAPLLAPDASLGAQAPTGAGGESYGASGRNSTTDDRTKAADGFTDTTSPDPLLVLGVVLLGVAAVIVVSRPVARRVA